MSIARRNGSRPAPAEATDKASWMHRGAQISETAKKVEAEVQHKRNTQNAYRFWLSHKDTEGREVMVLDDSLDSVVAFHEHNLKDSEGKYSIYEPCVKETEACPLCAVAGDSYYIMYVSVLDLTPYIAGRGTPDEREVPCSRKLLGIKTQQIQTFRRLMEACIAEHGTMRGMIMRLVRDGDKSPKIGNPVPVEGARMYDFYGEDDILEEFGHDAITNREGKVVVPADGHCFPYEYATIFPRPSAKDLRTRYGGHAAPGSRDEVDEAWKNDTTPPSSRRTQRSATVSAATDTPTSRRRRSEGTTGSGTARGRTRQATAAPVPSGEAPVRRSRVASRAPSHAAADDVPFDDEPPF